MKTLVHSATQAPHNSGYGGGYDVNAAAMVESSKVNGAVEQVNLWVINRANQEYKSEVVLAGMANQRAVFRQHSLHAPLDESLTGDTVLATEIVRADSAEKSLTLDAGGSFTIKLPPLSVNTISLRVPKSH